MVTVYIYGLVCPLAEQVRYVGLTRQLARRYSAHKRGCGVNRHLKHWVAKLKCQDKVPLLVVLEQTTEGVADSREQYWIRHFQQQSEVLVNLTSGGEGNSTPIPEVVAKMLATRKANRAINGKYKMTDAHKEAIRKATIGKLAPPGSSERFIALNKSRTGIALTPEHKEVVSKALTGRKCSDAVKANMSKAKKELFIAAPQKWEHCKKFAPLLRSYMQEAQAKAAKVRRAKAQPKWDKVVELRKEGKSHSVIGKLVGLSKTHVGKILQTLSAELSASNPRNPTVAES